MCRIHTNSVLQIPSELHVSAQDKISVSEHPTDKSGGHDHDGPFVWLQNETTGCSDRHDSIPATACVLWALAKQSQACKTENVMYEV